MMTTNMTMAAEMPDAELVTMTLDGNRDAFERIVSRYQSLICSLAYSATGSLGQSEDLAQETFITAWKHLRHLRERNKLRSWLCGIARNRINNSLRRDGREPLRDAEPIEEISESPAAEPLPTDSAISNEEAAILWRSLERIPEIYREPLILFYREHQSIEAVAEELDLTEDAVKQRLSRGRKLLQDQVLAFVEGALTRTNPGKAFTLSVLAALPVALSTSAKAAAIGAAAAKGASVKAVGTMGLAGVILSPLMVLFGNYIPYRIGLDEATSEEEREYVKRFFRGVVGVSAVATVVLLMALWLGVRNKISGPISALDIASAVFACFILIYLITMFAFAIAGSRRRRARDYILGKRKVRLAQEEVALGLLIIQGFLRR